MIFTPQHIRRIRPISENINDDKRLVPYIEECEKLFLLPNIGAKLYKQIESNINDRDSLLFDGGYYNEDNNYCPGLNMAMGYLVYSRFVRNQNVNVTAFSIVTKNSDYSEKVDDKTIVRIANDAEKIGLQYLKQCIDYFNFGKEKNEQRTFKSRCNFKIIGD